MPPFLVQMVIDAGLVPTLVQVLRTSEFRIQREAAWAVSNFTVGGSLEQVSCEHRGVGGAADAGLFPG